MTDIQTAAAAIGKLHEDHKVLLDAHRKLNNEHADLAVEADLLRKRVDELQSERDFLVRYNATLLANLENISDIFTKALETSRRDAFKPPVALPELQLETNIKERA